VEEGAMKEMRERVEKVVAEGEAARKEWA